MNVVRRNWQALFSLLLLALPAVGSGAADTENIKPPFGLQWGESSNRLETLLTKANARIVDRQSLADGEVWTVEGLKQQWLRRSMFYFKTGTLTEVELQYQGDDWDMEKYDSFMAQVRRRFEKEYGVGQLIARSKLPQGDVMQTLVGYKWNQNNTSLQLFYFEAENSAQSYRTVSVHYKNY